MAADEGADSAATTAASDLVCEQVKACWRCKLRLTGCRDPKQYFGEDGDLASGSCCGLCLGLLERGAAFQKELAEKVQASGFEANSYALSIGLPVLCVFRHYLLQSHLRSTRLRKATDAVDVKEVLKYLLSQELTTVLAGVSTSDPSAPAMTVAATGEFSGAVSASELKCLDNLGGGRRKDQSRGSRKRRRMEKSWKAADGGQTAEGDATESAPTPAAPSTASTAAVQDALEGASVEDCLAIVGGSTLLERLQRIEGQAATFSFALGRESIYFKGRYVKMSRNMPQSPWILDGERKGDSSVEEIICNPIAKLMDAKECKFHAEGREDIDVRMLGAGRTFVVEVKNAKHLATPESLEKAVKEVGGEAVWVRQLARSTAADMSSLQKDAENHRKTYVCVCWSQRPLVQADLDAVNEQKDLEIQQKTPVRVLHRRAPAVRPRMVHWIEAKLLSSHYIQVRVSTQAGAYIKEFVHGDLGRTRPSIRDLVKGSQMEITQLDVEGVLEGAE